MTEAAGPTKVRDVVRAVVTECAPHELPLVEGLLRFDDDKAVRVLAGRGARREPLGFGLTEATGLVTPVVWLVLDQAARRAADAATDGLIERGRAGLRRVLRRGPGDPPRTLPALEPDQLAVVRTQILQRATEHGITAREAEAIADAVVARLATSDSGTAPAGALDDAAAPSDVPGADGAGSRADSAHTSGDGPRASGAGS
ncbi:hypothetical protein [Streptomyces hygroscopicus]|uniref:hypothetical protein n=1 Tax=Streptomyces hygroscopicus TaxID=1912 RepID=UPI00223F9F93|nr:hypothetical protein [Streptomyces hygroscopicus]